MGPSIILLILYSLEGLDHLGNDLEEVSYDTVVCDLEDRSSIVLVYRDDALGILHACLVLDGTGDTKSDVDLRVNGLTGLAYLMVGGDVSGIDCGTGSAYYAAQYVSKFLSKSYALLYVLAYALTDGNDNVRADEVYELPGSLYNVQDLGLDVSFGELELRMLDNDLVCAGLVERSLGHNARTDGSHSRSEPGAYDGSHEVAAECRTGHLKVAVNVEELGLEVHVVNVQRGTGPEEVDVTVEVYVQVRAVRAESGVESGSAAGSEVAADVGSSEEHYFRLDLLDRVADDLGIGIGGVILKKRAVVDVYSVGTVAAEFLGDTVYVVSEKDSAKLYAELAGAYGCDLAEVFVCSEVSLAEGEETSCTVLPARGEKCPRCWNWRELGSDGLCPRCSDAVRTYRSAKIG